MNCDISHTTYLPSECESSMLVWTECTYDDDNVRHIVLGNFTYCVVLYSYKYVYLVFVT
jgi:hypothetical protein